MYIAQGQGQITSRGQNFDYNKNIYFFNHTLQISAISPHTNLCVGGGGGGGGGRGGEGGGRGRKFDLPIKRAKVNLWLSYEQT